MKYLTTLLVITGSLILGEGLHAKPRPPVAISTIINKKDVAVIDMTVTAENKDGSVDIKMNELIKGKFQPRRIHEMVYGCIGQKASGYVKQGKRYVMLANGTGKTVFIELMWEVHKSNENGLYVDYKSMGTREKNSHFPIKSGRISLKKLIDCVKKTINKNKGQ